MALDDILRALDGKADAEVEAIRESTKRRVEEIQSEVEKSVSRAKRLKLKKLEESILGEAAAIVYSASLKAKNNVIKAQEEVVEGIFAAAEVRLHDLRRDGSYPGILEDLIDGSIGYFDGEVVIKAVPEDRPIIEKIMAAMGTPYRFSETPLEASGGLIAESPGGEIVVLNTFESRLERAKGDLRLDISNTLFRAPE